MRIDERPLTSGTDATRKRIQWLECETAQLRQNIAEMRSRADLLSAWTASLAAELWSTDAGDETRGALGAEPGLPRD